MKELTKAYKCDYCGRILATKAGAAKHEIHCPKRPSNISMCRNCVHLTVDYEEWEEGLYGGYTTRKRRKTTFHCDKFDKLMYHPKALRMLCKDEILEQCDMKMPTIDEGCEGFEYPEPCYD